MKIAGEVKDYETYLWAKFQIEIPVFRFSRRPDFPAKRPCVTLEEEQGNFF